jgi:hypothetical protein
MNNVQIAFIVGMIFGGWWVLVGGFLQKYFNQTWVEKHRSEDIDKLAMRVVVDKLRDDVKK